MSNNQLPADVQERIKADAERFTKDEGYQKSHIAGATAEAVRAMPMYDALMELLALKEHKDKHGKTTEYLKRQPSTWQRVKEVLKQWKEQKDSEPEGKRQCDDCGLWFKSDGRCPECNPMG